MLPSDVSESSQKPRSDSSTSSLNLMLVGGILLFAGFVVGWFVSRSFPPTSFCVPNLCMVTPPDDVYDGPMLDETNDWETYRGNNFSFMYPPLWEDVTSDYERDNPINNEVISLRISQNAVFQASYVNKSYEQVLLGSGGTKTPFLVDGFDATKIEIIGDGTGALPEGYAVVTFAIKATENTSYEILFSGDQQDFTDDVIDQILDSFEFITTDARPL